MPSIPNLKGVALSAIKELAEVVPGRGLLIKGEVQAIPAFDPNELKGAIKDAIGEFNQMEPAVVTSSYKSNLTPPRTALAVQGSIPQHQVAAFEAAVAEHGAPLPEGITAAGAQRSKTG